MRTFTIEEIVKATEGKLLYGNKGDTISDICTDSREAEPGTLFFPLIGEKNDAHDYIDSVLEAGCNSIMVSNVSKLPKNDAAKGANIIQVKDTTEALQKLAKYYLNSLPLKKKIAVTGSVGKTSTRDMLYYIASTKYKTGRNPKNFNNGFGLPLTILGFPSDTEVAVLEMGMDGFGEIDKLAELVRPDIALITNIGISHIENLGSREGILKAKLEVTGYFDEKSTLIVNNDCDLLSRENVSGNYKLITVGEKGKNDYIISNICDFGDMGIKYTLDRNHKQYEVKLSVAGAHNATNATLAIAAGELLGISIPEAVSGLAKAELTGKRLNIRGKDGIKVIDDCYNACPDSMKSALDTLTFTKGLRKIAILGDMYELGTESKNSHLQVGEYASGRNIDLLIAIGKDAKYYAKAWEDALGKNNVMYFADKKDFIKIQDSIIQKGDVVLVKASRGMAMEEIVKEIFKDKGQEL